MGGKGTALCLVAFEEVGSLDLQMILPDNPDPIRLKWSGTSAAVVKRASEDYWALVDRLMADKIISAGANLRRAALLQLKAHGAQILNKMLSQEMQEIVLRAAKEASVLTVITDLLLVPWESLFFGDSNRGEFLGRMTTICRATHRRRESIGNSWPNDVGATPFTENIQLILLDPVLAGSVIDQDRRITLKAFIEEEVKGTGTKVVICDASVEEWVECARKVPFVHWVCEHEGQGLRIGEGSHFVPEYCGVLRFGSGILVLSGCETAAGRDDRPNFACLITQNNHIAVAAPAGKLGFSTAALFTATLHKFFRGLKAEMTVLDAWRKLSRPNGDEEVDVPTSDLTPEVCLILWYGLYGRVQQRLTFGGS